MQSNILGEKGRKKMNKIELQELANGDLQENFQKALEEVAENMSNLNTPWKNKREIIIKLSFNQNEARTDCSCNISVQTKLAPVKPIETKLTLEKSRDEIIMQEYGKQIRGQMTVGDLENVDFETGEIRRVEDFKES